jgi:hypothetical protein
LHALLERSDGAAVDKLTVCSNFGSAGPAEDVDICCARTDVLPASRSRRLNVIGQNFVFYLRPTSIPSSPREYFAAMWRLTSLGPESESVKQAGRSSLLRVFGRWLPRRAERRTRRHLCILWINKILFYGRKSQVFRYFLPKDTEVTVCGRYTCRRKGAHSSCMIHALGGRQTLVVDKILFGPVSPAESVPFTGEVVGSIPTASYRL